jgi:hypothetical protein
VWDYVKYYNTAWLPPQFTAGSLSKSRSGTATARPARDAVERSAPISVKQLCGMTVNTGPVVQQRRRLQGITSSPTTTSTTFSSPVAEMEMFAVGSEFEARMQFASSNSGANNCSQTLYTDGANVPSGTYTKDTGTTDVGRSYVERVRVPFGLHKIDHRAAVGAGTQTWTQQQRSFAVEARA